MSFKPAFSLSSFTFIKNLFISSSLSAIRVVSSALWQRAFHNSVKLLVMPCRATQDGQVIVENSDKMWSTGAGNGNPLQYSYLENPMNRMKRQKDKRTLKDELPRSVGAQYATGDRWRNNSRKNEGIEPKQKQYPVVDGLVIEARFGAVKGNITRNLEC